MLIRVRIFNPNLHDKTRRRDVLIKVKTIDESIYEDRKWLATTAKWAWSYGYRVETSRVGEL